MNYINTDINADILTKFMKICIPLVENGSASHLLFASLP